MKFVVVFLIVFGLIIACVFVFNIDIEKRATLIGIIIALGIFMYDRFYERWKDKQEINQRLTRCFRTISMELNDHAKALVNKEYPDVVDNSAYPFKSMFLNIDAYESLLHSGLFTHFNEETQDRLANLYNRVKLHNEFQTHRTILRCRFDMDEYSKDKEKKWSILIAPCDVILNLYQKEIKELIGSVKQLIDEEEKNLS